MKRAINLFFFIFLFSCNHSFAQITSTSARGFANLIVPLSITPLSGDLDFGEIILTGTPSTETISPHEGKLFEIVGHPNRFVTITFDDVQLDNSQWILIYGGNMGTIIFVPDVELENGKKIQSGDSARLMREGLLGKLRLWVGGTIDIAANQPPGDYRGLFVISVSY